MDYTFHPVQTNQMAVKLKIINYIWHFINISLFRLSPVHLALFRKYRVALLKLFGADIDWSVSVHPKSKIDYPWNLAVKHLSSLGENCWIYAMEKISIGEKSCIGKDSYLITGSHDISSPSFALVTKPINIGDCCWLTTRVTILPGVSIGDGSVISACSTVVKDVEPWSVFGGNPAKFIMKRSFKDA